jgi:type IV fimbrial biogenesis protein FimT
MAATRIHRPQRGLTLIELTVALAIVAVLMSLALPSFGSILARHRLKAAAEHLAQDLAELQMQVTQRGTPLHLNVAPGIDWCYALATRPNCDCHVAQSCRIRAVQAREHPGVQLVEGRPMRLELLPGADAGSGSATLQGSDGARLRVTLTRLGRASVCSPSAAVPGYPMC